MPPLLPLLLLPWLLLLLLLQLLLLLLLPLVLRLRVGPVAAPLLLLLLLLPLLLLLLLLLLDGNGTAPFSTYCSTSRCPTSKSTVSTGGTWNRVVQQYRSHSWRL